MTDTQREALHAKFRELGYTTNSQTTELLDVVFEALTQHQTQAQQAKCSHVWHAGLMTSGGYEAVCAKCGLRPEAAQFQAQQAEIDYVPGTWFKSQSVDQTQAFYLSRLPAIREAAREHGYAIGVHGSTRRDFDLIAMQWREGASDKDTLAHAIAMAACGIDRQGAYEWEEKGAGRVACSIPICWTPHPSEVGAGHIDLSLIKAQQATAAPALIGWRTDDYLKETSDIGTARGWDVHYKILPIFEGDRYTKLSTPPAAPTPSQQADHSPDGGNMVEQQAGAVTELHLTDIYGFAGWLTTRPGIMQVGSTSEAGPMAEAIGEYMKTFPERFARQPAQEQPKPRGGKNWHCHHVAVDKAALQMVRNALMRDAEEGKQSRREMLAELDKVTYPIEQQQAGAAEVSDEQIKGAIDAIDFSEMVTADDLFYLIARAILALKATAGGVA